MSFHRFKYSVKILIKYVSLNNIFLVAKMQKPFRYINEKNFEAELVTRISISATKVCKTPDIFEHVCQTLQITLHDIQFCVLTAFVSLCVLNKFFPM